MNHKETQIDYTVALHVSHLKLFDHQIIYINCIANLKYYLKIKTLCGNENRNWVMSPASDFAMQHYALLHITQPVF